MDGSENKLDLYLKVTECAINWICKPASYLNPAMLSQPRARFTMNQSARVQETMSIWLFLYKKLTIYPMRYNIIACVFQSCFAWSFFFLECSVFHL